jgi:ribonuclease BN (tRNA processing enzyme)
MLKAEQSMGYRKLLLTHLSPRCEVKLEQPYTISEKLKKFVMFFLSQIRYFTPAIPAHGRLR